MTWNVTWQTQLKMTAKLISKYHRIRTYSITRKANLRGLWASHFNLSFGSQAGTWAVYTINHVYNLTLTSSERETPAQLQLSNKTCEWMVAGGCPCCVWKAIPLNWNLKNWVEWCGRQVFHHELRKSRTNKPYVPCCLRCFGSDGKLPSIYYFLVY